MFLSLALCFLFQNPTFHWDQEVDQSYWQALHLLEVENDPAGAVEILNSLVDEPTVLQYRGQESIVIAQTYRALLRAGRKQEAEKLLPVIRRRSVGTEYEFHVEGIIKKANASQNPAGELDKGFMALVINELVIPAANAYPVEGLANAYGARLTPYLIELIQRNANTVEVAGSIALGVITRNANVISVAIKEFPGFSEPVFQLLDAVMAEKKTLDPNQTSLWVEFLIALTESSSVAQAKYAVKPLVEVSSRSSGAEDHLRGILANEESLLAPLALQLFERGEAQIPVSLLVEQIQGRSNGIGDRLRKKAYLDQNIQVVVELVKGGDERAKRMLPALLIPETGSSHKIRGTEIELIIGANLQNWSGDPSSLEELPKKRMSTPQLWKLSNEWLPVIRRLSRESNDKVRELCLFVALYYEQWELAKEIMEASGAPAKLGAVLFYESATELIPYLESLIGPNENGSIAAIALMKDGVHISPLLFSRMNPPEVKNEIGLWAQDLRETDAVYSYFVEVLRASPPPLLVEGIANNMALRGGRYHQAATDFLIENHLDLESPSGLLENICVRYYRNLDELVLAQGSLDGADIERMKWLIQTVVQAPWVDARNRSKIISWLRQGVERMSQIEVGVEVAFLPLIEDRNLASKLLSEFSQPIRNLPEVVARIVSQYPDLIGEREASSLLEKPSVGLLELLRHPDFRIRRIVLDRMKRSGAMTRSAGSYREQILESLTNPESASAAATLVVSLRLVDDPVPFLIDAWQLEGLVDRHSLMTVVGSIYDQRFFSVIAEGLRFPDPGVLNAALKAQQRYEEFRNAHETSRLWEQSGNQGSPVDFIIQKLMSEKLSIRLAAIESLATMNAVEALPIMIGLMEDEDGEVAAAAAAAVKKINAANGNIEEE
jgi:hypothetical protein